MQFGLKTFFKLFVLSTIVALGVRLFLLEDYRIASNSMYPGILAGDLVFISKSAFNLRLPFSTYEVVKFKRPLRTEVVAFSLPDRGGDTFVKRVVALEGDRVEIKAGLLYVNGTLAKHALVQPSDSLAYENILEGQPYLIQVDKNLGDYGPVDIPKDHFFALGDNRLDSIDSRVWGPVPCSCLKGRVKLVWLSLSNEGAIRTERIGVWVN